MKWSEGIYRLSALCLGISYNGGLLYSVYDYLISKQVLSHLRGCSATELFSLPSLSINSISICSQTCCTNWILALKKKKKSVEKWLFCHFLALSSLQILCGVFCQGKMGWRGRAAGAVILKKTTEMLWLTSTGWFHLVSSDAHRRQAQSLPSSYWAAGRTGLVGLNSDFIPSSVHAHSDSSQF